MNNKLLIFCFVLLGVSINTAVKALSTDEVKAKVTDQYFKLKNSLNAEINFKIENDNINYRIVFTPLNDGSKCSLIYSYVYSRVKPDVIEISSESRNRSLFKKNYISRDLSRKEEDITALGGGLDKVLKGLSAITFSNIKMNLTLFSTTENLASGKLNSINDDAKININDAQTALQKALSQDKVDKLDRLAFNLYLYALALSLVQHESLKSVSN